MIDKPNGYEVLGVFATLPEARWFAQSFQPVEGWALSIFGSDSDGWKLLRYPLSEKTK